MELISHPKKDDLSYLLPLIDESGYAEALAGGKLDFPVKQSVERRISDGETGKNPAKKLWVLRDGRNVAFAILNILSDVGSQVEIVFLFGKNGLGTTLGNLIRGNWRMVYAKLMREPGIGIPEWRIRAARKAGGTVVIDGVRCEFSDKLYDVLFSTEP